MGKTKTNCALMTGPDDQMSIRATSSETALVLTVEDTGCGIPREHLARIQEPFFSTKANGHGLGLAICRSIVAQLRGQFQIDSTQGAGTRVRAVLPLPQAGA